MIKSIALLASLMVIMVVLPVSAQEAVLPPNANKELIEENLFVGLASDNLGLQRGCALMLGTIQSNHAVIPLMNILHTNTDENLRVAAAWALCKIGDSRGVYAVKMAVKYDDCAKVQTQCAWYYDNLVKQGTFTFEQPEYPKLATTE